MDYDVFISHASEDKTTVALPLAQHLRDFGLKVWLDKYELKVGDSIRRSIDSGLSTSRFGVVILSPPFFKNEWTRKELDALLAKASDGSKVILPVWHNISRDEIARSSPLLADVYAVETKIGVEGVAREIYRALQEAASGNDGSTQTDLSSGHSSKRDAKDDLTPDPESHPRQAFDGVQGARREAAAGEVRRPYRRLALAIIASVLVSGAAALWWSQSRNILQASAVVGNRPQGTGAAHPADKKTYHAESTFPSGPPPKGMAYATIGFTVWHARPAEMRDGPDVAREVIDGQELASEYIGDDIADGDKFFLGIESLTGNFAPDEGDYLYVVNREQYSDGSRGQARLIFPTLLTYGGKNLVKPGQPIILPRPKGRPFEVRRSSAGHTAETFTVIVSPRELRLPERLGEVAMVLPDELVTGWEKQYGAHMYRATLRGGLGRTRTTREQKLDSREVIDTAETLTVDDPPPQVIYKGAVKAGSPALVTVALRYRD